MAAIPKELIESELFGHEKGAFTGAVARKPGKFEEAHGGTIFLDEIAELDLSLQSKILRVLQEREIIRVGGNEKIKLDIRLIVATHRNLADEVKKGNFREDLYYRLNTFQFELPPLRERREDIPSLVKLFVETFATQMGKNDIILSASAMDKIIAFHWPGNVRQLRNAIEYAVVLAEGHTIEEAHLPAEIRLPTGLQTRRKATAASVQSLVENEKQTIIKALAASQGNKKKAAELLGIYRPTLYQKIKRLGIEC